LRTLTSRSERRALSLSNGSVLDGGYITLTSPDDKGQVTIPADIEGGAIKVRLEGGYLAAAMRACGGMVDFKLTDAKSPTVFAVDGYQLVVMPMLTAEAKAGDKATAEAEPVAEADSQKPEAEEVAEAVAEAEAIAEAEAKPEDTEATEPVAEVTERKPKRSRKREKVAVA